MRQTILMIVASLLLATGGKDVRVLVLTPAPQMHCEGCENKIKGNLRFERGVSKIETDLKEQTVTVTYNPSKTSAEAIRAAMKKIGYNTRLVSDKAAPDGIAKGKKGRQPSEQRRE